MLASLVQVGDHPGPGGRDLPDTARLLTADGDARIELDASTGRNRYGRRPVPDAGLVSFGSSTASTISQAGFAAADCRREELVRALRSAPPRVVYPEAAAAVRRELVKLLGLTDAAGLEVALAASGTDVHLIASRLVAAAGARPPLVVLAAAEETGRGVANALAGSGPRSEVAEVRVRAADGTVRPSFEVEGEIAALVDAAVQAGRRVLLVLVDGSKTGLVSPTPAFARSLAARNPGAIDVLVDACQLRLAPATLKAYVELGFLVAITGSKFVGGPAFSGALLVPQGPAARLCSAGAEAESGDAGGFGLILRWTAALEELRAFAGLAEGAVASFLLKFGAMVDETLASDPVLRPIPAAPIQRPGLDAPASWDGLRTIFPFAMAASGAYLGRPDAELVDRWMGMALSGLFASRPKAEPALALRAEIGQPVMWGAPDGAPAAALRLSLGARTIRQAMIGPAEAQAVIEAGRLTLRKASAIAKALAASRPR